MIVKIQMNIQRSQSPLYKLLFECENSNGTFGRKIGTHPQKVQFKLWGLASGFHLKTIDLQ